MKPFLLNARTHLTEVFSLKYAILPDLNSRMNSLLSLHGTVMPLGLWLTQPENALFDLFHSPKYSAEAKLKKWGLPPPLGNGYAERPSEPGGV